MSRIWAAGLCLALAACGFQLRGEAPVGPKSLHVSSAVPSSTAAEIRRQLSRGSTKLASSDKDGEAHVHILSETMEKTIQTLTAAGRVFDFELRLKVGYRVTDAAQNALLEPSQVEIRRVISYSETAPLAKEAEERLLLNDMRAEAAARILSRVAVLHTNAPRP